MRKGLEGMLDQALSCSRYADVEFELDDGTRPVKGHRSLLCSLSEEFGRMFESGMVEDRTGVVRVRNVSVASFRGFLEWMYLGRPGPECKTADGRELWLLSETYDLESLQRWLCDDALDDDNICAAYEFNLVDEGDRSALRDGCRKYCFSGLGGVKEGSLQGVGMEALKGLVGYWMEGSRRGEVVSASFKFVQRWFRAIGGWEGCDQECMDSILRNLDLWKVSVDELRHVVKASGLVSAEHLNEVYESKLTKDEEGEAWTYRVAHRRYEPQEETMGSVRGVAVYGEGSQQVVAAVDGENCCVHVFNVDSGEFVMKVGSREDGPGNLQSPWGIAYNSRGEMYVSDISMHKISVFDASGAFLRSIGERGSGAGQFKGPVGLAFTPGGDLVVADLGNHRVQVLREDGTFLRAFGSKGTGEVEFNRPHDVAVDDDGHIYVADCKNGRVQVCTSSGSFVENWEDYDEPVGIAFGAGGVVFISDDNYVSMQNLLDEVDTGQILAEVGLGASLLDVPKGVACDASGRLFVGCQGSCNVAMLE